MTVSFKSFSFGRGDTPYFKLSRWCTYLHLYGSLNLPKTKRKEITKKLTYNSVTDGIIG